MLSQEMVLLGRLYNRKQKSKRRRRLAVYLILSVVFQLIFLNGIENVLSTDTGHDVEPSAKIEVRERKISLTPPPVSPNQMAVSADHKLLALADSDELRIYNLVSGQEIRRISLDDSILGTLQWLPDRNRLIYGLMNHKTSTEVVREPVQQLVQQPTGVQDETYSTDEYRMTYDYRTVTREVFNLSIYSIDDQASSQPELIQTLQQPGQIPEKIQLSLSTYTNLLYVNWTEHQKNYLVQVDIMKRIKDIRMPRGELTRLVVSSRSGNMWAELTEDNLAMIYKYEKGRWKLQKHLDGYRLLGVTPDERLAVAPDQAGEAKEVNLVDEKENFNPAWAFSRPIKADKAGILEDGRLMYLDTDRVIIYTPQLGKGTVFEMPKVDGYSPDRKMLVSWQQDSGELNIMEEVTEKVTENAADNVKQ